VRARTHKELLKNLKRVECEGELTQKCIYYSDFCRYCIFIIIFPDQDYHFKSSLRVIENSGFICLYQFIYVKYQKNDY